MFELDETSEPVEITDVEGEIMAALDWSYPSPDYIEAIDDFS